jgi:poly-gamma-glutamate synthesis protein (capsule biosynthesis protein)
MMKRHNSVPMHLLIITLLLGVAIKLSSQEITSHNNKISLLFIGDIMGHDEQIWSAENRDDHTFDYDDVFRYIQPVIYDADIAVANFEVTLAGPPYKGYPRFSSPAALADACRKSGIEYLVTANNHSADRGLTGIINTINRLDSLGIRHTGTFVNKATRDSLFLMEIKKNDFSLAILNYTFSTNGIHVPQPVIVNMLDKEQVLHDIDLAREKAPDMVILFLHWGKEYDSIPSSYQVDLARSFLLAGADIVIGSHPHVLQKMILAKNNINGKDNMVVYSLGNFITNQRKPGTDGGAIVRIDLERQEGRVRIANAGFYLTWVYTPIRNYRKKFYILPCAEYENNPGFFTNTNDFIKMKSFITRSRNFLTTQNTGVPEIIYSDSTWILKN